MKCRTQRMAHRKRACGDSLVSLSEGIKVKLDVVAVAYCGERNNSIEGRPVSIIYAETGVKDVHP